MLASDLTPMAMVFVAMCGGAPAEEPTSTGLTCSEYNLIIKVEIMLGIECDFDSDCTQVVPAYDECPTADRILNEDFDADYLLDMIDEAEGEGCTVEYWGDRGDCSVDAEPTCNVGVCRWQ